MERSLKRLIQVFKAPSERHNPPGLGDLIRGMCVLADLCQQFGWELRVDVSHSDLSKYLVQDDTLFYRGDPARVAQAGEYFAHHDLMGDLERFSQSDEPELYLCTNTGDWRRTELPDATRAIARKFLTFTDEVRRANDAWLGEAEFDVLHIRCGDKFFKKPNRRLAWHERRDVQRLIEQHVLGTGRRVVLMSDSIRTKQELVERYGFIGVPSAPSHSAQGSVLPTMMDMEVMSRSKRNSHISVGNPWWSGFSHWTSLAYDIPEFNAITFRKPLFEETRVRLQIGNKLRRLLRRQG